MSRYLLAVILALAFAFATPAAAGPIAVFKGSNVWVYAFSEPCDVPALAEVFQAQGLLPTKRAVVKVGEAMIPACYAVQGDKIIILDSDGDGGYIDASEFEELAFVQGQQTPKG